MVQRHQSVLFVVDLVQVYPVSKLKKWMGLIFLGKRWSVNINMTTCTSADASVTKPRGAKLFLEKFFFHRAKSFKGNSKIPPIT